MSFYKYQSAIGGEREKEMLVFVYMFFFKRKNTRASSFYRCFTILRLRKGGILCTHKCGIIFTRYHIFIWWRKTGVLNCFCNSFGTDIGASIFYHCFTILRKCGIIYTRFRTIIRWRKTSMLKYFCNSFGTDLGADTSSQNRSSE